MVEEARQQKVVGQTRKGYSIQIRWAVVAAEADRIEIAAAVVAAVVAEVGVAVGMPAVASTPLPVAVVAVAAVEGLVGAPILPAATAAAAVAVEVSSIPAADEGNRLASVAAAFAVHMD